MARVASCRHANLHGHIPLPFPTGCFADADLGDREQRIGSNVRRLFGRDRFLWSARSRGRQMSDTHHRKTEKKGDGDREINAGRSRPSPNETKSSKQRMRFEVHSFDPRIWPPARRTHRTVSR
jgi:hypothetical protein